MSRRTRVANAETSREPKHPRRLLKKKNMRAGSALCGRASLNVADAAADAGRMSEEAMEAWRAELAGERPSAPPPGFLDPAAEAAARGMVVPPDGRRGLMSAALFVPLVAGAVVALCMMVIGGWPPPILTMSPVLALLPLAGAAAALATGRRAADMLKWSAAAAVSGTIAFAVLVPVWAVLDFLECWSSWLANC